jgi:ketosteroid isomerase-like protein
MSQENVEIVRRLFDVFREGFERGDFVAGFDAELVSEDLEWIAVPGVGLGTYRGRQGFIEFMEVWTRDFENWWIELDELIDAGEDRVVAIYRQSATGKASRVPMRGDVEASLAYFHPEVEWSEPPDNPGARTWRGHEGIRRAVSIWEGAWENYRYEVRELLDCGGDRVFLAAWQTGRGKASGVEISEENFSVYDLREGRIVKQRMFRHRAQALEAAGLSE